MFHYFTSSLILLNFKFSIFSLIFLKNNNSVRELEMEMVGVWDSIRTQCVTPITVFSDYNEYTVTY